MLQNIRDKSNKIIIWTIVIILIATFALWGVHTYVSADKNSGIVARVDRQSITQNDINASYQRMRQQQQVQLGANFSLSQSAEKKLKQQALNQLILSQALINAAQKAGYRVTISQVNEALLQIPAFQENGQFSRERFLDILNSMLYSQDQFLADMRSSMVINQVQGGYVNSAFSLPNEVDDAIKLVNQKRDVSYFIIPSSRFNKKGEILPAQIKAYYQQNPEEFQSPEKISIEYLLLSLNDIKSQFHFDHTKLQQYYETHLQNYTQPAQWHTAVILFKVPADASNKAQLKIKKQVQQVYEQLKSGADFSKLAEKYSEDSASAKHGGELTWFRAGTLDPIFEKAVANLQKTGDISTPIKTASGFSLIKLLGHKKPDVLSFEKVKPQIENALAQQHAEQTFSEQSDKLSNLTYANPDSLEVAAKTLNLPVQISGLFDRKGEKSGIIANPRLVNAAFSNDVLQRGNNSDLLQLDSGTVAVLRVKLHKPASVLPLPDVQNTIQTKLRNKMAQQEAQKFGEALIVRLKLQNISLSALSKRYGFSFQEDKNAGRYDSKADAVILNQAFKMPHPSELRLSLTGISLPSGDYAIIMVNAIHEGVLSLDNNIQRRIFQEEMESNYGHADYQLYVRKLMETANIKFSNKSRESDNPSDNALDLADNSDNKHSIL